jgi:hypothetical protein
MSSITGVEGHHRVLSFHGDAAQCIDGIQQASMLHEQERTLPGGIEATADRYAFILFADLHHA